MATAKTVVTAALLKLLFGAKIIFVLKNCMNKTSNAAA
jgi:hypothetical protein